ncbi:MAG: hypothetical protein UY92_C0010G0008 [Candidatus Magasanikbacteria bacterium GW2011_GWA2_56_11]|uniref:Aldehyde dehydrogenase domain-containing protein n=1 Tax=Candidatus Magasanikbacteria bacterium GW2011_GWA2_56_11 TaxID=1619044 RepID=A0A0G2ALC4_9BACT|nr:MAG: hypothetical protein UY92_C0010G0008 [Candidatus Magasanikbacteria bacterium GW2011_GWA2_56_11]
MPIQSTNPATGEIVFTYPELAPEQIQSKLAIAEATFQFWKEAPFSERAAKMKNLAGVLRGQSRRWAEIMTREMGKPITAAMAEVEKCAWVCEYYAENAERILAAETIATDASESFVRFEPLGSVLAVMPWNFPFWQVYRFAAPAVMAGNVALLKHASNVPGCAEAIQETFAAAGFAEGIFQNLLIGSNQVDGIVRDPRVKAVTLTGSEYAGRKVAEAAGDEIKPSVLELGGSDAFIVLEDADLEAAAKIGAMARLQNCGQSCIAAKRFIVVEKIADNFIELFKQNFEATLVGDPMDEATQMGPLISEKSLQEIERQVKESIKKGARLATGGQRLERPGSFFAPTILTDVKPGMPAYEEEIFGPVAAVITVRGADEAVRAANDSRFGLGSSLWTGNLERAKALVPRIEAGSVFINGLVKSDPRLPFGGLKKSGYGRELSSYGIKEFVNIKTVWIK